MYLKWKQHTTIDLTQKQEPTAEELHARKMIVSHVSNWSRQSGKLWSYQFIESIRWAKCQFVTSHVFCFWLSDLFVLWLIFNNILAHHHHFHVFVENLAQTFIVMIFNFHAAFIYHFHWLSMISRLIFLVAVYAQGVTQRTVWLWFERMDKRIYSAITHNSSTLYMVFMS